MSSGRPAQNRKQRRRQRTRHIVKAAVPFVALLLQASQAWATISTTSTTSSSSTSVSVSSVYVLENKAKIADNAVGAASVSIVTSPSHGTASVSGLTIIYTPANGYTGPDTIVAREYSTSTQVTVTTITVGSVTIGTDTNTNTNTNRNTDTISINVRPPSVATVAGQGDHHVSREVLDRSMIATTGLIHNHIGGLLGSVGGGANGGTSSDNAPQPVQVASSDNSFFPSSVFGDNQSNPNSPFSVFANEAYSYMKNDEAGGEYDGNVHNFVGGGSYKLNDHFLLGLAAGYEKINVQTLFNTGTLKGDGTTFAPYFGYRFDDFVWDGTIGITHLNYYATSDGGTASGSYDATRTFVDTNLTRTYMEDGFRIAPTVGILYAAEDAESYVDSSGDSQSPGISRLGRLSGGGEIGYPFAVPDSRFSVEPYAEARLEYDFVHNGQVTLANGELSQYGDFGGVLGGGLKVNFANYVSGNIQATYDTVGRANLNEWTVDGLVQLNLPF